jgi:hypothetical protein
MSGARSPRLSRRADTALHGNRICLNEVFLRRGGMDSCIGSLMGGGPMGWLDACFAELPDPRPGNATRHDLIEVVTIALVASVCGAESCMEFADLARPGAAVPGLPHAGERVAEPRHVQPAGPAARSGGVRRLLRAVPGRPRPGRPGRGGDRRQDAAPVVRLGGRGVALAGRHRLRLRGAAGAGPGGGAGRRQRDHGGTGAARAARPDRDAG